MIFATIFDIEKFAIYDGPGIRTTIFFKGCNLKCLWCQNPEGIPTGIELYYDYRKCLNCNNCTKVCPIRKINKTIINRFYNGLECLHNCTNCFETCTTNAIYKIGKKYSINELVQIVLEDLPFYKFSNGGITLSGGEPLIQVDFVKKFLKIIKKYNIHVIIETAGNLKWINFKKILKYVDTIYYDLKIINEKNHIKYTGFSNKLLLKNLIKLSNIGKEIVIRIPLIPLITDIKKNIENIISFINDNNLDKHQIEILPFNEISTYKYKKTGINCKNIDKYYLKRFKRQSINFLIKIKRMFEKAKLKVKILSID